MNEKINNNIEESYNDHIAIIGMTGRFPGAKNVEEFWGNISNSVDSIKEFTDEELRLADVDEELINNPKYVKRRGVLEDIELFDPAFFLYNPLEAAMTDPQHRIFLECAWEALEMSGYVDETYSGRIGVYAGSGFGTYMYHNILSHPLAKAADRSQQIRYANDKDYLSTRTSYKLNLRGPSINVQQACSTSLVALHLAVQGLLTGDCDIALAGGVTISSVNNTMGYLYKEGGVTSPDGKIRAFDAEGKGIVAGNGIGIVVLKRLEEALEDHDQIHAVIRATAVNNDGFLRKLGYTAPSVKGQQDVIKAAHAKATVDPETITYVECHGTGTELGDPIEVMALAEAFNLGKDKIGSCAIGSVKSNIGHLDTAAGVAGLIKAVMALKNKKLPPNINFNEPNPNIDFSSSPFYVNTELQDWETNGHPRRAGVSAFGIGGTNAHVILEEAPRKESSGPSRKQQLVMLSAKTRNALENMTVNLVKHLKKSTANELPDIAYTLKVGRREFEHRRFLVVDSKEDAIKALQIPNPSNGVVSGARRTQNPKIVFAFQGLGGIYPNIGKELYESESIFRQEVDRCAKVIKPLLGYDIRTILMPAAEDLQEAEEQLKHIQLSQIATFVIEYSLAKLLMSWKIEPQAMIGHSFGEYITACLSGVFSLENVLKLVSTRGRLMQELIDPGANMVVLLSEKEIQKFLGNGISLAAVNSSSNCLISGPTELIDQLHQKFKSMEVECFKLPIQRPCHSEMSDIMIDSFMKEFSGIKLNAPKIPYVSCVTGTWITPEEATSQQYWAKHTRQTVRFAEAVGELLKDEDIVFVEIGPGRALSTFTNMHPNKKESHVVFPTMKDSKDESSDMEILLTAIGRIWVSGAQIDWNNFYKEEIRHRVVLPTYPFEKKRYWIDPYKQSTTDSVTEDLELLTMDNITPKFERPIIETKFEEPADDIEQLIQKIWQETLGIEKIGIHDNFFDLGGHSLVAFRIMNRINEVFHMQKPITTRLFSNPTVRNMAILVKERMEIVNI
ncbi:acyltransferase domain-containing protein [Bacillus mycoides]|nr:type I polyketide synthase [Bacillus mycoides]MBE7150864.1 acyltransferase domain-containing protein [Bacillus mycoides]